MVYACRATPGFPFQKWRRFADLVRDVLSSVAPCVEVGDLRRIQEGPNPMRSLVKLLPIPMILLCAGPALAQTITNISPAYGGAGSNSPSSITITGTGFSLNQKATRFVDLNNADVLIGVTCSSTTTCTAGGVRPFRVPAGSVQTLQIYALVNGVKSVSTVGFIYYGALSITSLEPNTGAWNAATPYTINGGPFTSAGTGFPGMTSVYLGPSIGDFGSGCGSISACSVTAPSLTYDCCVPQGAKSVVVLTPGGFSNPFFVYGAAPATPTVISITPSSGPSSGGKAITIKGENFIPGTNSMFGSGFNTEIGTMFTFISPGVTSYATSVNCSSTTTCTAVSPAGSPGIADVQVSTGCPPNSSRCGGSNPRPSYSIPTLKTAAYAYAGLRVTPGNSGGTLHTSENGQAAKYTVALYSQPTANVNVAVTTSGRGSLSTSSLLFTTSNWAAPQTVTITGLDDAGVTGNFGYSVQNIATSTDLNYHNVQSDQQFTNLDNETKGFFVSPQSGLVTTRAGGTTTFTLVLTKAPTGPVSVTFRSNDPLAGTVFPTSQGFVATPDGTAGWNVPRTITITGHNDGSPGVRRDYSIVLTAFSVDPAYTNPNHPPDLQVTNIDPITTPNGLHLVRTGPTTVKYTWSPVPDATFYSLKYSVTPGGAKSVLATATTGEGLTNLIKVGQLYYFVVSATNAGGESADSAEVPFRMVPPARAGDFDADLKSEMTIYKANGDWAILNSSGGYMGSTLVNNGGAGFTPVPGDYNGDGKQDVAVYRNSFWQVDLTDTGGTGLSAGFGIDAPGSVPVPGDYDGDAKTDFAVYHPSTGVWTLWQTSMGYAATTIGWGGSGYTPIPGQDFDGDGRADIAVYRQSTGQWSVLKSSTNYTTVISVNWGGAGYSLVPGDYDGDGKADIGLYHRATGWWYILRSGANYTTTISKNFGGVGYTPVPADYDGDGKFDLGIFQQSTGNWHVLTSTTNYVNTFMVASGASGSDRPVTSAITVGGTDDTRATDFDDDARAEITVYETTTGVWSSLTSSTKFSGATNIGWGGTGYTAAPGDFDGDGRADLGIYRESTGNWSVLLSGSRFTTSLTKNAGGPGWAPVPGDYDGDGMTDFVAYNTTTGQWFGLKSGTSYTTTINVSWGGTGYTAVPGDFDGDGKTDLGLYHGATGNWSVLLGAANYTTSLSKSVGGAGYIPVQGDYDGDGKTDFVVYHSASGLWYGLKSSTSYTTTVSVTWGGTGYVPVRGDYDGDGNADLATYQTSAGIWYILLSGANYTTSLSKSWGGVGYVPVPIYP
jgi:hypothetical protein